MTVSSCERLIIPFVSIRIRCRSAFHGFGPSARVQCRDGIGHNAYINAISAPNMGIRCAMCVLHESRRPISCDRNSIQPNAENGPLIFCSAIVCRAVYFRRINNLWNARRIDHKIAETRMIIWEAVRVVLASCTPFGAMEFNYKMGKTQICCHSPCHCYCDFANLLQITIIA